MSIDQDQKKLTCVRITWVISENTTAVIEKQFQASENAHVDFYLFCKNYVIEKFRHEKCCLKCGWNNPQCARGTLYYRMAKQTNVEFFENLTSDTKHWLGLDGNVNRYFI